ncbi:MAG: ammonia channel protein, partial [Rhodospirillales bacterium]
MRLLKRLPTGLALAAIALLAVAGSALAQDAAVAVEEVVEEVTLDSGDTAWMLTATALVLLMTI